MGLGYLGNVCIRAYTSIDLVSCYIPSITDTITEARYTNMYIADNLLSVTLSLRHSLTHTFRKYMSQ